MKHDGIRSPLFDLFTCYIDHYVVTVSWMARCQPHFLSYNVRRIVRIVPQPEGHADLDPGSCPLAARLHHFPSGWLVSLQCAIHPLQLFQNVTAQPDFNQLRFSHTSPLLCPPALAAQVAALSPIKVTGACLQCYKWLWPILHPRHGVKPYTPSRPLLATPSLQRAHSCRST